MTHKHWKTGEPCNCGFTSHLKDEMKAQKDKPGIAPPNYRVSTDRHHCGNCKMYDADKSICWGYGNRQVDEHAVCDSWTANV